jgi:hypothetical protein
MLKRGVRSPDEGDALALTFAAPVYQAVPDTVARQRTREVARVARQHELGWMAV